jgi:protein O-GlcNAc transferase
MRLWFRRRPTELTSESNSAIKAADSTRDSRSCELNKELGDAHLKLGELHDAERCYRLVLESQPLQRNALINLGFVLKELGRIPESVQLIDRALRVVPDDADAHYLRGTLYEAEGDLLSAVLHLERAVTLRPEFEFAYRQLVVALFKTGRTGDATRWCDRALERIPNSGELHFYRSNLHKHANATDSAIASARTALKLRPNLFAARSSLNDLLVKASQACAAGRDSVSSDHYLQQAEEIAAGYADLGLAYLSSSDLANAQAAFEEALALAPKVAEYHYNLGTVLRYQRGVAAAAASFDKAIALDPDNARTRWARSLVHASPFPESPAAAEHARMEIIAGLEEFSRWCQGRYVQGEQFVGLNAPFYLSYQEQDNRPVLDRYGTLCAQTMGYVLQGRRALSGGAALPVSGRMRIGIVSRDIREHSVWFALIKGWLEHFDRKRFEIGVFSLTPSPDQETEWAKLHADFFVSGPKSLQEWIESVHALNPAVLIYPAIGLDPLTLQLASVRLAPTQVTTWGHPETSGLPTIDLYLSGENFEPVNAQQYYSERLVPLRNLGNCYQGRVQRHIEPDLDALGIDPTRPILICSGTAFKYQAEYDRVLTQIATQVDGAQLIFFRQRPESLSDLLKARLERVFSQEALNFDRHVRFIPTQPLPAFHGLLSRAHIALDTIGFSGYNTAIQAIESSLPLVTREGRFLRGRLGSGILRQLGIIELIAQTTDEYVSLAWKLSRDSELQGRIRSEIVRRRAIVYNDIDSIRHLENVLENHAEQ